MSRTDYALFHDIPKRPLKIEGPRRGHRERLQGQCIRVSELLGLRKVGERAAKLVDAFSIKVPDRYARPRTPPRNSVRGPRRWDFGDMGIVRRSWQRVDTPVALRDFVNVGHGDGR